MGDRCHEPDHSSLSDRPRPWRRHAERNYAYLGVLPGKPPLHPGHGDVLWLYGWLGIRRFRGCGADRELRLAIGSDPRRRVADPADALRMGIMLPESVRFLVLKNAPSEK